MSRSGSAVTNTSSVQPHKRGLFSFKRKPDKVDVEKEKADEQVSVKEEPKVPPVSFFALFR
jgi:hypothetical protein